MHIIDPFVQLSKPTHDRHHRALSPSSFGGGLVGVNHNGLAIHALTAPQRRGRGNGARTSGVQMYLNNGFLNVGTPELALVLLVGYFVLGPQDLYKVAKETGAWAGEVECVCTYAWMGFWVG